jgi:Zn-dependent protease with chaperone function
LFLALAAGWVLAASLLWQSTVPAGLHLPDLDPRDYFSAHQLERTRDYERFLRVDFVLAGLALLAVLYLYAQRGARFVRESAAGRIGTGMLLGMLGFAFAWLSQLPFGLAGVWWERRHGVSKQGYVDWLIENWLGLGGTFLFVSFALLIVMGLARPFRQWWWLPAAPAIAATALLVAFVQPYLVPNLHSPKKRTLVQDAKKLEQIQGLSGVDVKVQDVHRSTTTPNAEATGFGPTRRVILWDTLLNRTFSRREVRNVIAHELGHHSRHHILKGVAWTGLFALPGGLLVAVLTRRRGGLYEPTAVPLALFVVAVLQLLALPAQNVVVRHVEQEADWVALETARDPAAARALFEHFSEKSLAQPKPPTWSYVMFENHPTIIQRIALANAWGARQR